ncbi:XRE family transcriptional regulator [Corynebacterium doosanense CAU 212 = DSM 45436]|uniref:XRE family transcriptional regulator n=2 Tax=Corynebacterium TaxID=1716 RepID=A0A097IE52_9CORY|nr:XRE family transcriptional regulator [Corynebacterium doosanense CAU 212 = DSM 45436]
MAGQWAHWGSYGHTMARRLRAVRTARGMSQTRLAELAGVSRNVISNLERNENAGRKPSDPQLSTVYRLAQALAVPPAALLPGVGERILHVCPPEELPVAMRWPADPADLRRFSPRHLALAEPGDEPEFVVPGGD